MLKGIMNQESTMRAHMSRTDIFHLLKDSSYRELLYSHVRGQVMVNMKGWLFLPQLGKPRRLSEEQSYPRLVELMHELDKERGNLLTDKQVNALQAVIQGLIDARARIMYYEDQ